LAALLVAPSPAQASCGNYVTLGSASKNATLSAGSMANLGQMPPADHSGTPRPCSGPNCSSRKPVPPLPSVPTVRVTVAEANRVAVFTLATDNSSAPLADTLSSQLPLQNPSSIYHPPR